MQAKCALQQNSLRLWTCFNK